MPHYVAQTTDEFFTFLPLIPEGWDSTSVSFTFKGWKFHISFASAQLSSVSSPSSGEKMKSQNNFFFLFLQLSLKLLKKWKLYLSWDEFVSSAIDISWLH